MTILEWLKDVGADAYNWGTMSTGRMAIFAKKAGNVIATCMAAGSVMEEAGLAVFSKTTNRYKCDKAENLEEAKKMATKQAKAIKAKGFKQIQLQLYSVEGIDRYFFSMKTGGTELGTDVSLAEQTEEGIEAEQEESFE